MGTWKSDQRRTLRTSGAYCRLPSGARKRRFAAIFGKLILRYTPKFCYQTLDGETNKERYDVVAEDDESLVLRYHSDQFIKTLDPVIRGELGPFFTPKLHHLHFDCIQGQEFYWIGLGGLCEWFKKQGPTKRARQ